MRVYYIFICLLIHSSLLLAAGSDDEPTLEDTVKEYTTLQKSIDSLLKIKTPECHPEGKPGVNFCSIKDFCSISDVHTDAPILYQNAKGEKILNDAYYKDRADLNSCLREKFADDIKDKRDALNTQLGNDHLKKIIAANKKLNVLTDKFKEGAKIQKISSDILTMSLEEGIKGDTSAWEKDQASRAELLVVIARSEKRTKTTLNPDIKKALVEIQYLKKNPIYKEEVARFEKSFFPDTKLKDPFVDWSLLLDESAAGGKKALEENRAKITQKTQDAYALFKDTQLELIAYLDGKKTAVNADKIERIKERITTIRFLPPRLTKELKDDCATPNAFYSSENHSFTVCPQMLEFPKMALMETMAHEISHSFDSCFNSGKIYKKKGPMVVEEAPFEIDIKTDPVLGNYTNTFYEDPEDLKLKDRIQDKMLYADHPFVQTLSCLQDPKSVHAEAINIDDIKKRTKEALSELTKLGQNNPSNGKARYLNFLNEHEDFLNYFQGCDYSTSGGNLGKTQLQEAFADKMASEVVARKLKSVSKAEAEKSILEISLTYDVCSNEGFGTTKLREFAVDKGCPNFFENKTLEDKILVGLNAVKPSFDPHPDSNIRVERNILAHPGIRKALNCGVDPGVKYCE